MVELLARGARIRTLLTLLVLSFGSLTVHAAMNVTGANVVDATTVGQGTVLTLRVTVGGSGIALNDRTWRSAQVLANAVPLQCVDITDALTGGIANLVPLRTFNVAAPAATGTYTISVVANNNDSCTGATSSAAFSAPQTLTVSANPLTPITFVGANTGVKASDASNPQEVVVAVPSGSAGDVLLAIVTTDGPTDVAPVDTTAWTLLGVAATSGPLTGDLSQATAGMWYRVATGSEPASYTFAWTVDANPPPEQQATAVILRYSGVDTKNPINAFAAVNGFDQNPLAPSVTTTVNGAVVVRAHGIDSVARAQFFPAATGPAVTSSPVITTPAPHGRFELTSNAAAPLNAVSSAGSDQVQLGGAGATGTARFGLNIITDQQWRAFTTALAPGIDLAIAKSESIDPVIAGSGPNNLVYTITVTNNGVSTATNITVDDVLTLPAGVTASVVPATGSWAAPTWTIPSLNAGASTTLTVNVTVDATAAAGTDVVSDTATITGADQGLLNLSDDTITVATSIATSADVSATKTDSPDPVNAGSNLTYTITIANAGPSVANTVSWADTLPAGTTFVSLSSPGGWSCTTPAVGANGTINCSIASLLGNAVFTLVAAVDPGVAAGTILSNTVTTASATPDPSSANDDDTETTTVSTSADLSLTKTDSPDPVNAGQNLTYTITVQNAGPSVSSNPSWSDTLPTGTTFDSLTAPAGWSCTTPAVGATGTVNCSRATLALGSEAFTLVVAVDASLANGTILSNTASATDSTTDPNAANDSATQTTTVGTSADLAITKTDAPDPVTAGNNVTYTINVTNNGPSTASTVSWSDPLPGSTTFVSLSAAAGWSCTTPAVGASGTITCSIATLPLRTDAFTLTVATDASLLNGAIVSNTATVTATTADATPANGSATATTAIGTGSADLSVTKSAGSASVSPGQTLQYTITVTNAGPSAATNASLSDPLPANTTFTSLSAAAGWSCTTPAVGANGTVTCTNASFAPGSAVFTLTVTVAANAVAGSTISNTATVSSATTDPNGGNGASTAGAAVISPAAITATKTASGVFTASGPVTYTIVLSNQGTSAQADNPGNEFLDVLPTTLDLISATATSGTAVATPGTNTVTWNGSIPAGGTVTLTISATIDAGVAEGTLISNQGSFSFDADGNGTNESNGLTDDPTVAGPANATAFAVSAMARVPSLDATGLAALSLLLAMVAVLVLRRL